MSDERVAYVLLTTLTVAFGILIAILAIGDFIKWLKKKSKQEPEVNPDVKFLEDALEDDKPRNRNLDYSWDELQRDLHDGKVTFDEIWEKSGGRLPRKPDKRETACPRGPDGMNGFDETFTGVKGMDGFFFSDITPRLTSEREGGAPSSEEPPQRPKPKPKASYW